MNRRYGLRSNKTLFNILFLAPTLIFFAYGVVIPFAQGIPYSFTNWNAVSPDFDFIGLRNYITIFTEKQFFTDFKNTLYYTLLTTIFCNLFGLIFAIGVYKTTIYNNIFRTIYFMPFVLSLILAAYIWKYIYTDVYSPLFNVYSPLATTQGAIPGIAVMSIWRDSGYCMIIFIAALQSIPADYNEAAMIDGAGPIQRFLKITLPLLVPAFSTNITLLMSWGFKVFEFPMAATRGGSGGASETISMYAYNNIFAYFNAGLGQAASVIMVVLLAVITLLVSKAIRSKEVEL
ncbi:carbohydrate ABC transporter permease [Massiliimalia massiliensis]|uniref:carbohydrate ABC transporter permease n=1 Tax=Massiliimalia massiliensis TaxID=1852384 RepID=UPI00098533F8|nr:sugar ABC transporter permease [Massiliimalia massiliensis]